MSREGETAFGGDRGRARPNKALGQHFLQDANIARKIVRTLAVSPGENVLEIGPGPGALTAHIMAGAPGRLVLVEKDIALAGERRREFDGKARVIAADALTMPWERFRGPWKLIGNLPYNVASPLMWEIFSRMPDLVLAVFMIQKEVGQRITAAPGDAAYGALSVWVRSFMRPKLEFLVPPQVFFPRPGVDSAVLSFRALGRERGDFSPLALAGVLHACFQRRRKQLGGIVRACGGSLDDLRHLDLDPRLRPERLTVDDFHRLAGSGIFAATRQRC
jgi:16S rRNA (adenine1518-N6/adenine1519-N6)-dimethyltransferase